MATEETGARARRGTRIRDAGEGKRQREGRRVRRGVASSGGSEGKGNGRLLVPSPASPAHESNQGTDALPRCRVKWATGDNRSQNLEYFR